MYRLILESLLGLSRNADRLRFSPCLPASWPSCEVRYRFGETVYRITIRQAFAPGAGTSVRVDGIVQPDRSVHRVDDGQDHVVEVVAGARAPAVEDSGSTAAADPFVARRAD
jgi:cellobiose phosphorylase